MFDAEANRRPSHLTRVHPALLRHLTVDDDPALWDAVLDHILPELEWKRGQRVAVGRCSHWLRPHRSRWTAGGGFANPLGYTAARLPGFDWFEVLDSPDRLARGDRMKKIALRIAIPSRTTRHAQAAIHTRWTLAKEPHIRLYGFRKKNGLWTCTAAT